MSYKLLVCTHVAAPSNKLFDLMMMQATGNVSYRSWFAKDQPQFARQPWHTSIKAFDLCKLLNKSAEAKAA